MTEIQLQFIKLYALVHYQALHLVIGNIVHYQNTFVRFTGKYRKMLKKLPKNNFKNTIN